jgi:WD40 repeat protein
MSSTPSESSLPNHLRLQPTGALREGALYIERAADTELFKALSASEFCTVLAPRQIGKSSLRVRTARRLEEIGIRCAQVDLTALGKSADRDPILSWYFSFVSRLSRELRLPDPKPFFYEQCEGLLPVDRFGRYLRHEALSGISAKIVVFIDEIDYIRALPIDPDEFFVAIRSLYNERAEHVELDRLTFCLLGVASPRDLVTSSAITQFNIGRPIRLTDFSRADMTLFAPLLSPLGGDAAAWLDAVYDFTAGHPYMNQALLSYLLGQKGPAAEKPLQERVTQAVHSRFLRTGRSSDDNLSYAEKRLDHQPWLKSEMLSLYRRLLEQQQVPFLGGDPVHQELQLCGMAAPRDDGTGQIVLRVRNRIFARVFDLAWVREKESHRALTQALRRWQDASRSSDTLLRGAELELAQNWAVEQHTDLSQDENEFLRASLANARREAEQARRASEAKNERIVILGLGLFILILITLSAGLYAQYRRAEREEREATQERLKAERAVEQKERARKQAESAANIEKSLRAAALAWEPGKQLQSLIAGMQAAEPERKSGLGPQWEGANRIAEEGTRVVFSPGHLLLVGSAAHSPDGLRIVTTNESLSAKVLEARTGRVLLTLTGHSGVVRQAAFSPDGLRIVTASDDKTARVFDARSGRLLLILSGHSDAVFSATYSPDGLRIATASRDATAGLFNARDGRLLRFLKGHSDAVHSVAYSPDGQELVTASEDSTARLWDAQDGRPLWALKGHSGAVRSAAFSATGDQVFTESDDGTTGVWDVKDGRLLLSLRGHSGVVRSATFSPDGLRVLSASDDKTARVFDAHSGRLLLTLQNPDGVNVLSAAFSPDGLTIATVSQYDSVTLWDGRDGHLQNTFREDLTAVQSVAFSPDGQRMVAACEKTAKIFDVGKGQLLLRLEGHSGTVLSARYSQRGDQIVTASEDQTARIWDAQTGSPLYAPLRGHSRKVNFAAFSPDGTRIVTASADQTAGVFDAHSGSQLLSLKGHSGGVFSALYSPDGQLLVTASADQTATLWDARDGHLLLSLKGHLGEVLAASFAPDGRRIVTAGHDDRVLIHPIEPETIYDFDCTLLRGFRGLPQTPATDPVQGIDALLKTCPN